MNALRRLRDLGQSVWLDDIRRSWLIDGRLQQAIDEDGITGVTSNPSIFEQAFRAGGEYDEPILSFAECGRSAGEIYEELAIADVRTTADLLAPVHERTAGADGYVSFEVSPRLAYETAATIAEATRLWQAIARRNALIKVPATGAGLPAIRSLLAAGINVNVTLLFDVHRYRQVVEAFLGGLEDRLADGQAIDGVASVASFFVSRIDTHVDARLDELVRPDAIALRGRAAVSAARLVYRSYREWQASPRWNRLAASGARPQMLLWASTSTKDPAYPDTKYVAELIAPQTINTMPIETMTAFRGHGRVELQPLDETAAAEDVRKALAGLGIDLGEVGERLQRAGVEKFVAAHGSLLAALEMRIREHGEYSP